MIYALKDTVAKELTWCRQLLAYQHMQITIKIELNPIATKHQLATIVSIMKP